MKNILIIGGGFAGTKIAKQLENKFNTTLIDTKSYFEFTPSILKVLVSPEFSSKIQVKHENYLKKTNVIVGEVSEADETSVTVNNKSINFDYLVIASGSRYHFPIKEKNISLPNRISHIKESQLKVNFAKKITIIGGGLVGVELAGEITESYPDKKIELITSGKIINRNNKKTQNFVRKFLEKRGVNLIENTRVKVEGKQFKANGKFLDSDHYIICTGIIPNSEFLKDSLFLNSKKGISVEKTLQLRGFENIFAVGDVNNVLEEKTAQNAESQAQVAINNICNLEKSKDLIEYVSKKSPLIISLGSYRGVLEYNNFVLTGVIPAILKKIVERISILKK